MDYHKTTIALIAWLVWVGDKKTADKIGRDEYFSVIGLIIFLTIIYFIMEYLSLKEKLSPTKKLPIQI
jgi:hypothetical protein